jgi:protein SCO1
MNMFARRSLLTSLSPAMTRRDEIPPPTLAGPRASYFPNVRLRTHENTEVRFYDDLIHGKIVLITFMFANCDGVCPIVTSNLRKVQDLLGDRVGRDVFMYSITLKPREDTPEALSHYAAMHQIKPGWLLLTGQPSDIELLRRKLGFVELDSEKDRDVTQHISVVRFGNESLDRWGACPAMASPAEIVKRVRLVEGPRDMTFPG